MSDKTIIITEDDAVSLLGMLEAVREAAKVTGFPEMDGLNRESNRLTKLLEEQIKFNELL